jgi:hypothetical protein
MWPVLRPTSGEHRDGKPAGVPFTCHISSAFEYPKISLSFHFLKRRLSPTTHQQFLLTRVGTIAVKDKLFQAMKCFELPLYSLVNNCLDNWIKYLHGKTS